MVDVLLHFSEDPAIERFVPHVPRTNPTHRPAVWAIDAEHAPLYWFPRDCPRVTAWARDDGGLAAFQAAFGTRARRVHAMAEDWVDPMARTTLYRYELPGAPFAPWAEAEGQWIAETEVEPLGVGPVGDLVLAHQTAGIELRVLPSLEAIRAQAIDDRWGFSIVRLPKP